MASGSYTHYGFYSDPIEGGSFIGPLLSDLDLGGNDIINVDTITANTGIFEQLVVNTTAQVGGDVEVTGCINGGVGLPANLCEGAVAGKDINMQTNDIINVGDIQTTTATFSGQLTADGCIRSTGGAVDLCEGAQVGGPLQMPLNQPLATTDLLNVTTTNVSGTPTSTPPAGSLIFNDVDNILWIYDGTTWIRNYDVNNPPPAANQNLAQVLAVGNQTGANDIRIDDPQKIQFLGNILIEGNLHEITINFDEVTIGNQNTNNSTSNSICIGKEVNLGVGATQSMAIGISAESTAPNSISLGLFAKGNGASSIGIGRGAQANNQNSIALGYDAITNFDNSVALGRLALTTEANQLRLGTANENVSIPGNLDVEKYITTGFQKSCAGGIISTDPPHVIGAGLTETVPIESTRYDDSPPMIDSLLNIVNLTDQQQVFGVSVTLTGTINTAGGNNTISVNLVWWDGTTDMILATQDIYVPANWTQWNCTLSTGAKTIAAPGQYIYCTVFNDTNKPTDITKYRISATRIS